MPVSMGTELSDIPSLKLRHDPRIGGPIACDEKCLWALCESEDGVRMEVSMLAN